MKVMFVAPRFHTNQREIVNALIERGHIVSFYSIYIGNTEDHTSVKPTLIPSIDNKKEITDEKTYVDNFVINKHKMDVIFKREKPDLVILRNKSRTMRIMYKLCKKNKIDTLLYNQEPLFREKKSLLKRLFHFAYNFSVPSKRITPVLYDNYFKKNSTCLIGDKNARYLPFIVPFPNGNYNKMFSRDNKLRIIDVGKYRSYKNHFLLIDAIDLSLNKNNILVTIVGQCISENEKEYYAKLKSYILQKGLEKNVNLVKNVDVNEMNEYYSVNDLFVLCSVKEDASVSVLEAMAYGLPQLVTSNNGTSFVITENTGRVFNPMRADDLKNKIDFFFSIGPVGLKKMSEKTIEYMKSNHTRAIYVDKFEKMVLSFFKGRIV